MWIKLGMEKSEDPYPSSFSHGSTQTANFYTMFLVTWDLVLKVFSINENQLNSV